MDSNVYEGKKVTGQVTSTISRGRLVWHDGQLNVTRGSGRFVAMPPGGPLFEGLGRQAGLEEAFPYGPLPVQRPGSAEKTAGSMDKSEL